MVNVSLRDRRPDTRPGGLLRWPFLLALVVLLIAAAGIALDATVERMGDRVARAGYRLDRAPLAIQLAGRDLTIPANMIRFAGQRRAGQSARLDLFVRWPRLEGVTADHADAFASSAEPIVFLTLTPPGAVRPPIVRLETVYRYLFEGPSWIGPDGLVGRRLAAGSAYGREELYYEPGSVDPFLARCLDDSSDDLLPMCLVEFSADGLSVVYRFNRALLPEWRALHQRLQALVAGFRR